MRKFMLTAAGMAAALTLVAAPVYAKSKSADTLRLPAAQPLKVTVSLSEDLLHRADNLPKDRRDRGSARGLNSGWSANGYYGLRDLNRLKDRVADELADDLAKSDIAVSATAGYELRVTLVDA